ncbi:XrtV sorting system accessory protein [Aquisalinus flavus]|uniref:Uncharacterized protein n=1 Tax=Aquisalinus flavus TaxID=1526572 RepID=A0A8J2Y7G4_9PROT|nr:XrtV sorting system accessory protein [Aquisalinus flavus]MBD0425651.1 hypothetical protein [Aquisalinus flavus]UNE48733.1 hypothetical protein FF099_12065 [Aquisalinus flavus]GGD14341.1 hypothetical protein GCM10011342_23910 [Aquisalinus flavus]
MGAYFNFFAIVLFVATAAVYVWRSRTERPRIMPYLVTVGGTLIAMIAGNNGAFYSAIVIFAAAGFLLVHQASQPFDEQADDHNA